AVRRRSSSWRSMVPTISPELARGTSIRWQPDVRATSSRDPRHGADVGPRWADDATRTCFAGVRRLLTDLSVGELGDDVKMTEMAGVLLKQVEQDAFERCWVGTFPAGTWFAYLGEVMGLDDGAAALGLRVKSGRQV